MANQIFMRVNEVAEELGSSIPFAYRIIRQMNEELAKTGCIQFRYTDWKDERQQKLKCGFATKREALEWEREFLMEKQADVNMTFESFVALYEKDIKPKLKLNTWLIKESIIKKKIVP